MNSPAKIFITGINGFIGSHIAQSLVARGFTVSGLARENSSLENISDILGKIELHFGDVRKPSQIRAAMKGAKAVIHTAALVKHGRFGLADYIATNLGGTMNVAAVALEEKVERFIYTSSCETLRMSPKNRRKNGLAHQNIDENSKSTLKEMMLDYGHSKFLAEEHVRALAHQGLPAVILNPTAVMGPGDINCLAPNRLVISYLKGRIPVYFETGFNIVDVRDVANAHILALTNGQVGSRYIIGAHNVLLSQLFQKLSSITGKKPFGILAPYGLIKMLAQVMPVKDLRATVMASELPFFLDSSRAGCELKWKAEITLDKTLQETVEYFSKLGRI